MLGQVLLAVVSISARVGVSIAFFLLLTGTAHFRLGRYADLQTDFGGAGIICFLAFGVCGLLRVFRVIYATMGKTINRNVVTTWGGDMGIFYSTGVAVNLVLTAIFYIRVLHSMRRLANSEYYMHPAAAYRASQAAQRPPPPLPAGC